MTTASMNWRRLLEQLTRLARSLAAANAGRRGAARDAMMAITTSNSMRVKPRRQGPRARPLPGAHFPEREGMSRLAIMEFMAGGYFGSLRMRNRDGPADRPSKRTTPLESTPLVSRV